jgi:ATP-dependent DNA helicase RecG
LLQYARDIASDIILEDPELCTERNIQLNQKIKSLFSSKINWGMIS